MSICSAYKIPPQRQKCNRWMNGHIDWWTDVKTVCRVITCSGEWFCHQFAFLQTEVASLVSQMIEKSGIRLKKKNAPKRNKFFPLTVAPIRKGGNYMYIHVRVISLEHVSITLDNWTIPGKQYFIIYTKEPYQWKRAITAYRNSKTSSKPAHVHILPEPMLLIHISDRPRGIVS